MSYRLVAVPDNKLDELPEGSDLLEPKNELGPTGHLVKQAETEFGPLTMRIHEGEEGMNVTCEIDKEQPWEVNGIAVSGYYVVSVEGRRVEYGSLSRVGTWSHDDATDSAKCKVKQACVDALEEISDSELQEGLIRSRQSQRFTVMNRVAREAQELVEEYNRVEGWA
jgi:hypothetical protein